MQYAYALMRNIFLEYISQEFLFLNGVYIFIVMFWIILKINFNKYKFNNWNFMLNCVRWNKGKIMRQFYVLLYVMQISIVYNLINKS